MTNDAQSGAGTVAGSGNKMSPVIWTPPPSVLYKYAPPNIERISRVVGDGMIYFSSPLDFNDPFDCWSAADVSTPDKRERVIQQANEAYKRWKAKGWDVSGMLEGEESEKYQKTLRDNPDFLAHMINDDVHKRFMRHTRFGVCCLTEKCDNVLMWAHYADNHEGVCFEFNLSGHLANATINTKGHRRCFPFEFTRPVKYQDDYPYWEWGDGDLFTGACCTKSKEWEYEKEWRALMVNAAFPVGGTNEPALPKDIGTYKGWGEYGLENGLLAGVILGCRIKNDLKQCVVNLAKQRGIKISQASIDPSKYGLRIRPYEEPKFSCA